jgi:hypothetical protein
MRPQKVHIISMPVIADLRNKSHAKYADTFMLIFVQITHATLQCSVSISIMLKRKIKIRDGSVGTVTGYGRPDRLFTRGNSDRGVKLTTNLHLLSRSRVVQMYFHSPLQLHGMVLNCLNTRRASPSYL